jgi:hypothetical protein
LGFSNKGESNGNMTGKRWRFSLRDLFLVTTLFATLVAMCVNYPAVAVFVLVIMSPFLFAAAMALSTSHMPVLKGALLFLISAAVVVIAILALASY